MIKDNKEISMGSLYHVSDPVCPLCPRSKAEDNFDSYV